MLGQLAWTLRDRRLAERLYPRLLEEAGRPLMVTSLGFLLVGHADHELMRVAAVLGRWDDARRHADAALAFCVKIGARPLAAEIRADWDEAVRERDRGQVGAPPPTTPVDARPTAACVTCTREGEFWTVAGRGELCRIKDSRGMQMLARLLDAPDRELHALDLSGAEAVDAGDAGELLDRDARAAYQTRLAGLREDLAQAEAWNDAGRRDRLADEIAALEAELAGAYGLGGRERRTGSAVERARQNVRRRLADAMRRIEEACPALGRHLAATVRTGTTCSYAPGRGA
jgi:hypothetical protein